jgi:hypothetical protein
MVFLLTAAMVEPIPAAKRGFDSYMWISTRWLSGRPIRHLEYDKGFPSGPISPIWEISKTIGGRNMGVDTAEFAGLLDLLYEGLLRPEAWGDFLSRLGPRVGCERAALTFHDSENRHPEVISSVGMSAALLEEWTS